MSADSTTPDQPSAGAASPFMARVEQVFFEVSAVAPKDRDQAIARLCAGDAELEREVRSLVGSAVQLGSYLEQPALGREFDQLRSEAHGTEPPDPLIGQTLGPFTVERRIASGGMGTVYLAERSDGQFAQKVAIKVVKRGMDSEEILRRFRRERETLAALDHPNIARLLDGGLTTDGRPFVVMEYIDGSPIDSYCDNKGLGLRDRLRLFREVCAGVQHAHQNLVIHRDLKPSNILVTPQGIPKLLDFGIAKVLSGATGDLRDSITAETDRRLTPEYASPEQVEGVPLTTASDVYSLGVVLYELLTGARPYHFGLRTHEEVRRVVCSLQPLPPSEAVTVRAGRLKTAGLSAPSASPGPADSHPISLNGTTHTLHAATAPAPVDLPKTRGVSSTRLRGLLRGDLDVIVLMALRKEPDRRYVSAEQFSADVARFLEGMPVRARRDTLGYRASKFVRRHALGVGLASAAFVLLSTSTAVLYHQDKLLRAQKASLIAANARLDENLKRLGESRRFLQKIIAGAGTANPAGGGPDAKLGDVLKDSVAALKSTPPKDPMTLAAAEIEVGRAMMSLGMLAEARPLLEHVASLYADEAPTSDARMDSALTLGELLFFEGKHAEAEATFRRLLDLERSAKPAGSPATERETAILNDLGASVRLQGRADEAIALQREALAATIAVMGEGSLEAAETRNNLASALFQRGDVAAAVQEFARACDDRAKLLRPGHPLLVRCRSNLGLAQLRAGNVDQAVALLTESADAWDEAFGPEHPGRIATITSLSQALRKQGKHDVALSRLRACLAWQQAHQPAATDQLAATEANIAITLGESGNDAEARTILERTLPALAQSTRTAGIRRAALESLAAIYDRASEPDKARQIRDLLNSK